MTTPAHADGPAPVTASAGIGQAVIVYDRAAARRWLLGGAADEHSIDESFTTTELTVTPRLEALVEALGSGDGVGVWTTRLPLTNVLIWRTADGDGVDGGCLITIDLTVNDQPIRLGSRHQGFDDFTQNDTTSGIDAAVEALGHVADLVNTEVDVLRRALTPPNLYTVIGVWQDDEPIPVGVIAGEHDVTDGDLNEFEDGLWATSVAAPDSATAQHLAIDEMRTTLL